MNYKERILKSFEECDFMEEYDIKPSGLRYKTLDDIRIALGLKPWDEFAVESIWYWLNDKHTDNAQKLEYIYSKRRTGQTTKMLIEAVYTSQFKPVFILGWSELYSHELVMQAQDLCREVGLDETKVARYIKEVKGDVGVFVDHYTGKDKP